MFSGWGQDGRSERFKCETQSTIDTYKDDWNHKPRNAGDIKGIREAPRQQLARKWDPAVGQKLDSASNLSTLGRKFSPRASR